MQWYADREASVCTRLGEPALSCTLVAAPAAGRRRLAAGQRGLFLRATVRALDDVSPTLNSTAFWAGVRVAWGVGRLHAELREVRQHARVNITVQVATDFSVIRAAKRALLSELGNASRLLRALHANNASGVSGVARPEQNPRPALCRRALLMPQVNPGSRYCCGKRT